ncbi:hypothetical protein [Mucilaginibacter sp. KACC 22063]|uniref:hypothetical protein n=1 Tax=Mucilaginibacter sp. KACC 22063 TaxID=3025666 RepID=UPI002365EA9F|nr:hypothetical protein [Mucilaginibacter sp. KACC 22063]WDF56028.1 hypothetical protein PQ461_03005 [Mucilaginibacter sp. KACC 22063]
MKTLNPNPKSLLKLKKETVSRLSVNNADGMDFPTGTFPTTSQLCFSLARLAERN